MPTNDMFQSAVRPDGDLAGVFEYDEDTGYFYLYETKGNEGRKIVSAIQVIVGSPDFEEGDVTILWDVSEVMVGLFIKGQLWAVFDAKTREKYGGNYVANMKPLIPERVTRAFELIKRPATH